MKHLAVQYVLMLGFSLLFCFAIGRFLLFNKNEHINQLLVISLSPIVGLAALSLQLWIMGIFHIPWNRWWLMVPWLIVFGVFYPRTIGIVKADSTYGLVALRRLLKFKWYEITVLIFGIVLLLSSIIILTTEPVTAWDTVAMWLYKAKVFYAHNLVTIQPFRFDELRHVDYPPLVNLNYDVFSVISGGFSEIFIKSSVVIYIVSAIGILYSFVRTRQPRITTLLLSFSPLVLPLFFPFIFGGIYMGVADYQLAVLILASSVCLYLLINSEFWCISIWVLILGICAMTKNEGLVFALLSLVIVLVWTIKDRPIKKIINGFWNNPVCSVSSIVIWVFVIGWQAFLRSAHISNDIAANIHNITLNQILVHSQQTMTATWHFVTANPIWLLPLILLLLSLGGQIKAKGNKSPLVLTVLLSCMLIFYFLAYLVTPHNVADHVNTSIDRLLAQVSLMAILVSIVVFFPVRSK